MLRFLLDENLPGPLWHAIQRRNTLGGTWLDATRVGIPPDLPLGSKDAAILIWAEREGRILLTEDIRSMPTHLKRHLQSGRSSPGIFILRKSTTISEILNSLIILAHAGSAENYVDSVTYIP